MYQVKRRDGGPVQPKTSITGRFNFSSQELAILSTGEYEATSGLGFEGLIPADGGKKTQAQISVNGTPRAFDITRKSGGWLRSEIFEINGLPGSYIKSDNNGINTLHLYCDLHQTVQHIQVNIGAVNIYQGQVVQGGVHIHNHYHAGSTGVQYAGAATDYTPSAPPLPVFQAPVAQQNVAQKPTPTPSVKKITGLETVMALGLSAPRNTADAMITVQTILTKLGISVTESKIHTLNGSRHTQKGELRNGFFNLEYTAEQTHVWFSAKNVRFGSSSSTQCWDFQSFASKNEIPAISLGQDTYLRIESRDLTNNRLGNATVAMFFQRNSYGQVTISHKFVFLASEDVDNKLRSYI